MTKGDLGKTELMQKIESKRKAKKLSKGEFARMELDVSKQKFLSWQNGGSMSNEDKIKMLEYLIES